MKGSDVGGYTARACAACGAVMPGKHRDDCEWLRKHTAPAAMTAPTLTDADTVAPAAETAGGDEDVTDKDTEYLELCDQLRFRPVGTTAAQMRDAAAAIKSLQAEVARLRAESAELREHANALAVDIETHDHECQRLCGEGDQEALGCGYRPYFEFSGRRCPHCPIHNKLDGMALAAYRAWKEGKK